MYYIDTSILAAYYCPEPLSEKVEKFILDIKKPAISALTEVELFSAIARKVREKNLNLADANRIINQYRIHRKSSIFRWISFEEAHFQLAAGWLSRFSTPLKTLDALHLSVTSAYDLILVTADQKLAEAAKQYGIKLKIIR